MTILKHNIETRVCVYVYMYKSAGRDREREREREREGKRERVFACERVLDFEHYKALQNWKILLKALSKRLRKLTIKTKQLW